MVNEEKNTQRFGRRERIVSGILYLVLMVIWAQFLIEKDIFLIFNKYISIPLIMIIGSFVAGFTSEGGGAIAFPIFSKVLNIHPAVARNFSFAIQSIGMSFAAVTILLRRIKIEKQVLVLATLGGVIGIIFGTFFIVPHISAKDIKLIFTLVVTSFGIGLFLKNYVIVNGELSALKSIFAFDVTVLLLVGFVGGIFSSIIGTGVDIITFSFITLFYKLNEKVATPTSVIIMAIISIVGFVLHSVIIQDFPEEAYHYWVLSVPVVAIFAPLGAILCVKVSRKFIIIFLLVLILLEFVTTLVIFKFNCYTIMLSAFVIIASLLFYIVLIFSSRRTTATKIFSTKGIDNHNNNK